MYNFNTLLFPGKLQNWLSSIKECVTNLNIKDENSSQLLKHLRSKIVEVF